MVDNWREMLLPAVAGTGRPGRNLERALREAIRAGRLPSGARLPSSRDLAAQLSVARGTVTSVYDQLIAEGYLVTRRGSGTRVADVPADSTPPARRRWLHELRTGMPALSAFPRAEWSAACRTGLNGLTDHALGYPDPAGLPELRTELASYLGRVRALSDADPVVTNGSAEALVMVARALVADGHTEVAVEDPSYVGQRHLLTGAGLRLVPVPVDDDGLRVDLLAATGCRAVVVTAAHQYPLGVALSPARRRRLVCWARDNDGLIIEDDYDAEHRYDRVALGAVQGLAPGHVAYLGTVSKTLAPALRIGWLVAPPALRTTIVEAKRLHDRGCGVIEQAGFAELLRSGGYDRHLRRTRRLYRQRRDALLDELAVRLPDWHPVGIAAGLHLVLRLPADTVDTELAGRLRASGIEVSALSAYALSAAPYPGLVVGYGATSPDRIRDAVAAIATAAG